MARIELEVKKRTSYLGKTWEAGEVLEVDAAETEDYPLKGMLKTGIVEKIEEYEVKVREHLESFIDSSSTNAELTFHLTAGRKRYIDTLQADIRLENPDGINCVSSSLLQEGLAYVPEESEDVSDDYRYLWREEEAIREGKNLWGFIEDGYI